MKDTKREINLYSIYDRTGLQKHLEEMAAKGWMLERIGQFFWHYRRSEAKKLRFAVSYFPGASTFDPAPSEKQETYREFCEHAGWKLAADSAQLEIYYNEDENAVPLVTDSLVEIETIHKTAKKTILMSSFLLLGIAIMQVGRFVYDYKRDTISFFLDNTNFFMLICWILIGVTSIVELANYFTWYFKAKKTAYADGSFVETKSRSGLMKMLLGVLIVMTICMFISMATSLGGVAVWISLGYSAILFGLVFGVKKVLKKISAPAKLNRNITLFTCFLASVIATVFLTFLVFQNLDALRHKNHKPVTTYEYDGWTFEVYEDELPLYLEDLMEVGEKKYSCKKDEKKSFVLKQSSVRQDVLHSEEKGSELSYEIIDVKMPAIYDTCVNYYLREASRYDDMMEYREVQEEAWEAQKVYKLYAGPEYLNTYLVCYENRIVRISLYDFDTENNPAFAKIISEKLKPN